MMPESDLILFGKHPAWSDHMFIGSALEGGAELKRVFYDNTVIPAFQATDGVHDERKLLQGLVLTGGELYCVISVPSSDAVGRSRFPLFGALRVPLNTSGFDFTQWRIIDCQLRGFLEGLLVTPSLVDLDAWQAQVCRAAESFPAQVSMIPAVQAPDQGEISGDRLLEVMSALLDGKRSFGLNSVAFADAVKAACVAGAQFRSPVSTLLILDDSGNGEALFCTEGKDTGFVIDQYLNGELAPLEAVEFPADSVLSGFFKSSDDLDRGWDLKEIPSLKLDNGDSPVGKGFNPKVALLAASIAFVLALVFGVFASRTNQSPAENVDIPIAVESFPARDAWIETATDYVNWIKDLVDYYESNPSYLFGNERLNSVLARELNPFSISSDGEIRNDLVKNPTNRLLSGANGEKLGLIHENVKDLKSALVDHMAVELSGEIRESLLQRGYLLPKFLSVEKQSSLTAPQFGPNFVGELDRITQEKLAIQELVIGLSDLERRIIEPLKAEEELKQYADFLQRNLIEAIAQIESLEEFRAVNSEWLSYADSSILDELDQVNRIALQGDATLEDLITEERNDRAVAEVIRALEACRLVEKSKFTAISEPLELKTVTLLKDLARIEKDFPQSELPLDAVREQITGLERTLSEAFPYVFVERSYLEFEDTIDALDQEASDIQRFLTEEYARLADPSQWSVLFESDLVELEFEALRGFARSGAVAIKGAVLTESNGDNQIAFSRFQEKTSQLLSVLKRIDAPQLENYSDLHRDYMATLGGRAQIAAYVDKRFERMDHANVSLGDLSKMVDFELQSIESHLVEYWGTYPYLEKEYSAMDISAMSAESLYEGYAILRKNPLTIGDESDRRFKVLDAAQVGKVEGLVSEMDYFWCVQSAVEMDRISGAFFRELVAYANLVDPSLQGIASSALRSAFSTFEDQIKGENPEQFLAIYGDLDSYLPIQFRTDSQKEIALIADHYQRYLSDPALVPPSESDLQQLVNASSGRMARDFFQRILAVREQSDIGAGASALEKFAQESPLIRSASMNDSRSRISVVFEGDVGELSFLLVEGEAGRFYVAREPLGLFDSVELMRLGGLEVDDYLRSLAEAKPHAFDIGESSNGAVSVSPLRFSGMRFDYGVHFSAIDTFKRKRIPMHANRPEMVDALARACGMRLLKRSEIEPLVLESKLQPVLRASLDFKDDMDQLIRYSVPDSSVYATEIASKRSQGRWDPGVDFERGEIQADQFIEVQGGSAELAYEDGVYYAFGGSWLFAPLEAERPVALEPDRIYIDLGIRLVMDPPSPSYSDLVKEVALELIQ